MRKKEDGKQLPDLEIYVMDGFSMNGFCKTKYICLRHSWKINSLLVRAKSKQDLQAVAFKIGCISLIVGSLRTSWLCSKCFVSRDLSDSADNRLTNLDCFTTSEGLKLFNVGYIFINIKIFEN